MSTSREKEEFKTNVANALNRDFLFTYHLLDLLSTGENVISSSELIEGYGSQNLAQEENGVLVSRSWRVKPGVDISRSDFYDKNSRLGSNFRNAVSDLMTYIKDAIPPDWFDELVGTRGTQGQQLFVSEELAKGYADTQRSILDVLQRPTSSSSPSSSSSSQINCPISLGKEKEKDKKKKKKKKDRSVLLKSEHSGEMIDL